MRSVYRIKLLVSLRSVAEGALGGDRLAVPGRDNVEKGCLFQNITKLAHICQTKSSVASRVKQQLEVKSNSV